jgi:hypothetical protein
MPRQPARLRRQRPTGRAELPDESPTTTADFLRRAWRSYVAHGISVERILTDNGGCYRSYAFAAACDELGLGHRRTRPYRPQTNGKAEQMVRTLISEWAYASPFTDTSERIAALPRFLHFYNTSRPHWSLAGQSAFRRLSVNNLTGKEQLALAARGGIRRLLALVAAVNEGANTKGPTRRSGTAGRLIRHPRWDGRSHSALSRLSATCLYVYTVPHCVVVPLRTRGDEDRFWS